MIMVNLLPDIRQAKLRERRRRQLASGIGVMVWAICGGVIVVLSLYTASQKLIISTVTKQVQQKEQDLKNVPDILDALTAEQHAASLPGLYSQRVYLTKFFKAFGEANPAEVSLTSLAVDSTNVLTVNGTGSTYATVAKLARAMEASNVQVGTGALDTNTPYFSNVAITAAGAGSSKGVSFTITATLAPGVTDGNK